MALHLGTPHSVRAWMRGRAYCLRYSSHISTLSLPRKSPSLLPLILMANNVQLPSLPYTSHRHPLRATTTDVARLIEAEERLTPFFLKPPVGKCGPLPLGLLRPPALSALMEDHNSQMQSLGASCWSLHSTQISCSPNEEDIWAISFAPEIRTVVSRTEAFMNLVRAWKKRGIFHDVLRGCNNEECPVFLPANEDESSNHGDNIAFSIQRAALPLFAFPNFGTFLIGYFECEKTQEVKLWVPRRSYSKKTFPGMLDVTVGGGIATGDSPLSTIIREAEEEASLPPSYVSQHIVRAGHVTFSHRKPSGWLLPGLYYTFDLPLPPDHSVLPQINADDGEVSHFELLGAQECLEKLVDGEFKPSSALAVVDFLIRHRLYNTHMDPHFDQVVRAMHKDLVLPMRR